MRKGIGKFARARTSLPWRLVETSETKTRCQEIGGEEADLFFCSSHPSSKCAKRELSGARHKFVFRLEVHFSSNIVAGAVYYWEQL